MSFRLSFHQALLTAYRRMREMLGSRQELDQVGVDQVYRQLRAGDATDARLPKGHSPTTMLWRPRPPRAPLTNAVELRASGLLSIVAPLATSRVKRAVAANLDTLRQILERQRMRPHPDR